METKQNGRCLSFQECAARGEDYEKVKLLEISAEDAERWERRKKRKNPDLGFSGTAGLCWPLLYSMGLLDHGFCSSESTCPLCFIHGMF